MVSGGGVGWPARAPCLRAGVAGGACSLTMENRDSETVPFVRVASCSYQSTRALRGWCPPSVPRGPGKSPCWHGPSLTACPSVGSDPARRHQPACPSPHRPCRRQCTGTSGQQVTGDNGPGEFAATGARCQAQLASAGTGNIGAAAKPCTHSAGSRQPCTAQQQLCTEHRWFGYWQAAGCPRIV